MIASPAEPDASRRWRLSGFGHGVALGLAATAFAALPLLDRVGVWQLAAVFGVAGASALAAWRSRCNEGVGDERPAVVDAQAPAADRAELQTLLAGILPVWKEHVEAVKMQTETAITDLVTSFSSISEQFEAAGFKGAGSAGEFDEASITLLTLCARQLQPVIKSMHDLMDGKGALAASVKDLAMATLELQNMASGVSQIAAQTNMLAINAAIEAARAGVSGRGFAVIAKEIRNLSQVSAQTGKQITERMAQVTQIMKSTVEASAKAAVHDQTAIELSGSVVEDVLGHVRELSVKAEEMRGHGNVIRGDIENLLVSLQFQDRVSQIITVIDDDIELLRSAVESGEPVPTADDWLGAMRQRYTMDDQRRIQASDSTPSHSHAPSPVEAVEFF